MAYFSRGRLARGLAGGALSVRRRRIDFQADSSRFSAISTRFGIKAVATGEQVHGDVEDVISFVVGQVQLEQRNGSVDFFSQVQTLGQLEKRSDSPRQQSLAAYRPVHT